jgi:hypothetical protein
MGWLFFLYLYLIVISNLVPAGPERTVWGMGGIIIVVAGIFVQDFIFMMMTNPYPYLRIDLHPSGRTIRLFIKNIEEAEPVSAITRTTRFIAQFPITMKEYGKAKVFCIDMVHEYPLERRMKFRPGQALYLGYTIKHPSTEHCIAYEYPYGAMDVDHANPVPKFRLKHASGDYFLSPIPLADLRGIDVEGKAEEVILQMVKDKEELTQRANVAEGAAAEWHRRCITAEGARDKKDVELRGVLEEESDFDEAVTLRMLTVRQKQLTIANALEKARGRLPKLSFNKWLAITVIACVAMIFAYLMKDQLGGFGQAISDPMIFVFAFGVVIVLCLMMYYVLVSKKR